MELVEESGGFGEREGERARTDASNAVLENEGVIGSSAIITSFLRPSFRLLTSL
jgi:hypothetical protein